MKRHTFLIVLLCGFISPLAAQNTVHDYVKRFETIAVNEMERTGIPASILLGQGILHSTFGNSTLALQAKNHFSIKCDDEWEGELFYKWDDDKTPTCFKVYRSAEESFFDHADYITNTPQFAGLFLYRRNDYKKWAKGLQRTKYSPNEDYAKELIEVIELFGLHRYDNLTGLDMQNTEAFVESNSELPSVGIIENNTVKAVRVQKDDTPFSIAAKYKVPLKKFNQYNDLYGTRSLIEGNFAYLKPKKSKLKGDKEFHIVQPGETLYAIAQTYGIKIKSLLKYNIMVDGQQPAVNEKIYLSNKAPQPPRLRDPRKPFEPTQQQNPITGTNQPKENIKLNSLNNNQNTTTTQPQTERTKSSKIKPVYIYPDDPNYGKETVTVEKETTQPDGKKPPIRKLTPTESTDNTNNPPPPPGLVSKEKQHDDTETTTDITDTTITPAQVLDPSKVYHEVVKGENLYRISKAYNTTIEQIMVWNNLKDSTIEVGQQLIVGEQ